MKMKKNIDLCGIKSPNIIVDGKRYILLDSLAELFFADNIMMYGQIEENLADFEGHVIEYQEETAIDYEGLCKFDLVKMYGIYVEVIKDVVEDIYNG